MHQLTTEIDIDAPPRRIWDILTDFRAYPTWNPFVRKISGKLDVGARLTVTLQLPKGTVVTMGPTLLVVEPERELRWLGHMIVPGLFDGEHSFRIVPRENGRVRFVQAEKFSGLLVPLAKSSLEGGTRAGFEAMNRALRLRTESGGSA